MMMPGPGARWAPMTGRRPPRSDGRGLRVPWLLVWTFGACADSGIDPDTWFPVSQDPAAARREAASALAVCDACMIRVRCLELSLRQWQVGQHGIWGGTLPGERKALRDRLAEDPRQPGRATS
jgi:hypothetical protein